MGNPINSGFNFRDSDQSQPAAQYTAIVSQAGTAVPTASVKCNTLGVLPALARVDVGEYTLTASGKFTAGTVILCSMGADALIVQTVVESTSVISITTVAEDGSAEDMEGTLFLQILVYPS